MTRKKKIFFLVLFVAVVLHAGGLILIHHLPFRVASFAFKKIGSDAIICESTRDEWVMNLVDTLKPSLPEIKDELKDLQAECAPPLEISLPAPESIDVTHLEDHLLTEDLEFNDLSLTEPTLTLTQDSSKLFEEMGARDPFLDFSLSSREGDEFFAESEHFYTNVEFVQRRLHPGYIFKVTLIAKQQIPFKRIRENYFFLIDRSNSIIRGRYLNNKKAVHNVLSLLKEGDTFNILIFDDHVTRLASQPLVWNEENVSKAKAFLEHEGQGGQFAVTDIYTSLGKILPREVSQNEINTAILLSDGDTYLTVEKQRQLIGDWTNRNAGKVSLFCIASGSGNNLPLLELISHFNKGELLYVSKHDQVGEKLKQLILSLQNPIGKGIHATAISSDDSQVIYLQPKESRLPELYKNRSYTIFGFTNRLSDFRLFLQGNYYDRKFDIKKVISFEEARRGTLFLEREWAELVAGEHYERFFSDGKMAHLEAAKELLAPFNVNIPFIQK